jgi:hypothetical protein
MESSSLIPPPPFSGGGACLPATIAGFAGFVSWMFPRRSASCSSSLLGWRDVSASYYCNLCLLKIPVVFSSLPLPPSPVRWEPCPLCCSLFQFLIYYSVFLGGRGQSVQGTMLVYPKGGCGSTVCRLFAHLLVCVSQAGLELASSHSGALLVSQYNIVWRSFVWAGDQGFASSWWFFPTECGSSILARFLIYRGHAVCFLPLLILLDPLLCPLH